MDRQTDRKLSSEGSVSVKAKRDASPQPREAKRRRFSSPANITEARDADDSELPLTEIREKCGKSIMEILEEIRMTAGPRDEASVFVRRLECLRLIDIDDTIKFKRAQIDVFKQNCAIASWRWNLPGNKDQSAGCCFIVDDNGKSRRSHADVRDSVWRRAAAYMRYMRVEHLWIDAECITQDNSDPEKEKAMGEMDLLYHVGSHPFGVLSRSVQNEDELNLLAQILQGRLECQSRHDRDFPLKKGAAIASARNAIGLLDKIISDDWWNRAWIYQENYHGGKGMLLLMPHDSALERSKTDYGDLFRALKGELIIRSVQFCEAVTEVCSAFITWSTSDEDQKLEDAAHRILSRAGRYSVLLQERRSMSPTVIADIVKRGVTNHSDRLAIIANCCSYNQRINSEMIKEKGLSVSLAILVLFLLNGEIFHCEPGEHPGDMTSSSKLKVVDFIRKHAFDRFSPPFARYRLSFNKGCRFANVSLKADGVHTRGHLWKLWKRAIKVPPQELESWSTVKKTLWGLHGYIEAVFRQRELACKLEEFLTTEFTQPPQSPAQEYMQGMAVKLADALHDGSTLRLGYLANSSRPGRTDPMGIFICPDKNEQESDGPVTVFTSFRAGSAVHSDVDKHVSLQVHVGQAGNDLPPKLYAREWMHGLWFWPESPNAVVFPLPRIFRDL